MERVVVQNLRRSGCFTQLASWYGFKSWPFQTPDFIPWGPSCKWWPKVTQVRLGWDEIFSFLPQGPVFLPLSFFSFLFIYFSPFLIEYSWYIYYHCTLLKQAVEDTRKICSFTYLHYSSIILKKCATWDLENTPTLRHTLWEFLIHPLKLSFMWNI